MRVLFVQRDHVSPVGRVGEAFAVRGFEVEELLIVPAERFGRPDVEVSFPDPVGYNAIVPMGAPWSVNDERAIGTWLGPGPWFQWHRDRRVDPPGVISFARTLTAPPRGRLPGAGGGVDGRVLNA